MLDATTKCFKFNTYKTVPLSITMVSGNPNLANVVLNSSITAFDTEFDVQKASSIWNERHQSQEHSIFRISIVQV